MLEWTGNLVYFAPDCVHSLHPVFAWKVPGAKIPGSESSRVLKFQGAKVPQVELSLPGANGLGSEKSSSRINRQLLYCFTLNLCEMVLHTFRVLNG